MTVRAIMALPRFASVLEFRDQRDIPRAAGAAIPSARSIGAYEVFEDRLFANGFE